MKSSYLKKTIYFVISFAVLLSFQFCTVSKTKKVLESEETVIPEISYVRDIFPFMKQKCTPCHFPERGRMRLLDTYDATRDNIDDILYRVQLPSDHKEFMPFKNKREALTEDEIERIKTWKSQGMPE